MSKIHVLPSDISNKIAAGEVVENAASVVKELIENSIDAGATAITVEIKNGGISYIRVTDNGKGIDRDDAATAFMRHATSKISTADDLEEIATLGFRGEALASIAAVSKIELLTKTKQGEGVLIELEGGNIVTKKAAGCPDGTTVVVGDLFYNTPARMKFLKSDKTETGYVTNIVERLVLCNPDISIKYIVDGKERLFFSGDGQLKSCIYSVYGRDYAKGVLELSRNQNNISVSGLIGKAELSRGNRSFQSFILNGRYVKNRALTYAAESAFGNALMSGRFPFFAIHINVPYNSVDVNVHPTKQEVKFANERLVCDEVYWAIKNALFKGADELRQTISPPSTSSFAKPVFNKPYNQTKFISDSRALFQQTQSVMSEPVSQLEAFIDAEDEPADTAYRIAGQLFGTYIIVEADQKMILIDQHAAHERMIYERLLTAKRDKKASPQVLISPVAVTLSPEEYAALFENKQTFDKMGFEIEEFGNNSILIRQIPTEIEEDGLKPLITELIERASKSDNMISRREEDMLEMIACKAAVKGNSTLHEDEIKALIDEVIRTNGVNTCPHGRPLMISFTKYELEKMFKRII